jgi:hypothetical protein
MDEEALKKVIDAFVSKALEELDCRMKAWPTDMGKIEVHEALGALLARQTTLATQIAECPPMWTGQSAPILLRAMADVHITTAWILCNPQERSRSYIRYGLGQAKLGLEHMKAALDPNNPDPFQVQAIESVEGWINSQRFTWLTEVNLGSWSGKNTREMADEAGCVDFYNYVYSPFSICAHSTWEHVGRFNLRQCQNPLHGKHRVAVVADFPLDPHYLYLAGKYLNKTFRAFDRVMVTKGVDPSAFALLTSNLNKLDEESSQ